jgi:hypothetical protein
LQSIAQFVHRPNYPNFKDSYKVATVNFLFENLILDDCAMLGPSE